jgi:hypothetical protein
MLLTPELAASLLVADVENNPPSGRRRGKTDAAEAMAMGSAVVFAFKCASACCGAQLMALCGYVDELGSKRLFLGQGC